MKVKILKSFKAQGKEHKAGDEAVISQRVYDIYSVIGAVEEVKVAPTKAEKKK